jgi:hypothetical protein
MEPIIGWGLATLSALLIGYLAGYLKKKAENRAIHEDIDKLVEQMKAVTQATKEIEAKISSDVWDRQKRWEMKREVLFSAVTRIAEMDDALLSFANVFVQEQEPENLALSEARTKSSRRWLDAWAKYDETKLLVAIVCEEEAKQAFDSLGSVACAISQNITKGEWGIYHKSQADFVRNIITVRAAIRKELRIDEPA